MIVAVLKGSFIFAADLVRALHRAGLRPEIDFIYLASYDGERVSKRRGEGAARRGERSYRPQRRDRRRHPRFGPDARLRQSALAGARASRVLTCVLVDKQVPRAAPITPDFSGFACPPVFVVGYGMDFHNRYRELPFIGELTDGRG